MAHLKTNAEMIQSLDLDQGLHCLQGPDQYDQWLHCLPLYLRNNKAKLHWVTPVAEWLRPLIFSALNRSSSHRHEFEPSSGHVSQARFSLRGRGMGPVFFLRDLPCLSHLPIDSAQNE